MWTWHNKRAWFWPTGCICSSKSTREKVFFTEIINVVFHDRTSKMQFMKKGLCLGRPFLQWACRSCSLGVFQSPPVIPEDSVKKASIRSHRTANTHPMQTFGFFQDPLRLLANKLISITLNKFDKIKRKLSVSQWDLAAEISISNYCFCASAHYLKKCGTSGKQELQMQSVTLSAVTDLVWVLLVLLNNFFRERCIAGTINWKNGN